MCEKYMKFIHLNSFWILLVLPHGGLSGDQWRISLRFFTTMQSSRCTADAISFNAATSVPRLYKDRTQQFTMEIRISRRLLYISLPHYYGYNINYGLYEKTLKNRLTYHWYIHFRLIPLFTFWFSRPISVFFRLNSGHKCQGQKLVERFFNARRLW